MKKLFSLFLVFVLMICFSATCFAVEENESTTLYLEDNEITESGNRHIKVTWDKVPEARVYILEIANNETFEDAVTKRSYKRGLYWNFSDVPDGETDTYYIRIKPCFYHENECVYGKWSNVIVAEYKKEELDPNKVIKVHFPWDKISMK